MLLSILALTACGGGSGGNHTTVIDQNDSVNNNTYEDLTIGNMDIPISNISGDVVDSNEQVTSMDSGITNIAEMTAAVEGIIGSDALDDIANNLENLMGTMTRSFKSMNGNYTNKEKAAYVALEGAKVFKDWNNDKKSRFFEIYPNMVSYWGKLFCGCNVNGFDINQYLDLFGNNTNQDNFNDFYSDHHYREYTLDNADFIMSSASNGDENGGLDVVKFELDNDSKIVGIKLYAFNSDEIGDFEHQNTADDAYIERIGDSNVFHFVQERDQMHDGRLVHKRIEGDGTLLTHGGENRYSDFGQFFVVADEYEDGEFKERQISYEPFAGGYAEKKIVDLPSESMRFSGKAVGTIDGREDNHDDLLLSGDATLTFDGTSEILEMQFNNWYNLTINKNINEERIVFTFDGSSSDDNFALNAMESNHKSVIVENPGNYNGRGYEENTLTKGKLKIDYYGDNNIPEEFVGVAQYVEGMPPENEQTDGAEIRVNLGFGGIRDNQ